MGEDRQITPLLFYYAKVVAQLSEPLYCYNVDNICSFNASFSEDKTNQAIESENIVLSFFKDKDKDFVNASLIGVARNYARYMRGCVRAKNKNYYLKLKQSMGDVSRDIWSNLPWSERITYSIKSFVLLYYVVELCHYIKISHLY